MKAPEPLEQHRWLQRMVGEWSCRMEGEDHPPWSETVSPMGDIWIVADSVGQMPDGTVTKTQMTLGYDPARGRFVGAWFGSMMNHMWVYDGQLDGDVLTLDCEGPDFEDTGRTAKYQDVITLYGDDRRTLTARAQLPDGSWRQFMVTEYQRKK